MVKITQEKVTVMLETVSGIRRKKGVQKYHISHKGTARLNPEYERIKLVASEIEKLRKWDIDVKRVIPHAR